MRNLSFVIALALAQISLASAQDKSIVVASTTSTQDSGLYGFILPLFKQKTGTDVKVVALGTGRALDMARRGGADVVLVHAREAEEKFIVEGFGVKRYSVMYNDFVIIGPKDDPASIKGSRNVRFALQTIKAKGAPFISRGDKLVRRSRHSKSERQQKSKSTTNARDDNVRALLANLAGPPRYRKEAHHQQ